MSLDIDELRRLAARGMTGPQIAKAMGVGATVVWAAALCHGILLKRGRRARGLLSEHDEEIAAMAPLELVGELAQRPAMVEAMMPPAGHQRDQRTAALVLALRHQGLLGEPQTAQQWAVHDRALSVVLSQPALVDVAELALATGQHLVVHAMRPAATRVVHETDLHTLPGECPKLLRRAFIVEADWQAGRVLWGTTACVGGFLRPDGVIVLVGLLVPDGVAVAYWRPDWGGTLGQVEGQEDPDLSRLLVGTDRKVLEAWATQAVRYLTVLSLLLEAAGTPLETRDESGQGKRPSSGKSPAKGQGWTLRYVSLSKTSTPVATGGGGSSAPADTTRLQAETVTVRGHLKRQPCGPGGTMRRTVYVAGYSARRWVAPETTVRVT